MVLNRALQALQLELQNGSDLISLGKQWQFLSLNLWNFYTEVAFCGSSGASQSPSCLSLLPFPLFPTSLGGEVRRPNLKPTFLLHEMLMSSRCEIKML